MASKSFNVVEFMVNTHGDAFKKEKVIAGPLPKEPILSYVLVPA